MIIPLKLITIIAEGLLKEKMGDLLQKQGATGFTMVRAEGRGSRGVGATDFEGPNYRFECIASDEVAEKIKKAVQEKYLKHYAVIMWLSDVNVLRGDKFVSSDENTEKD